jgi:hypothetical protein
MQVWIFANDVQVMDIAPRDENINILYEECCVIGEIIEPLPVAYVNMDDIIVSEYGNIDIVELENKTYKITEKIIDGYMDSITYKNKRRIYLVIDAGFLIRLEISIPTHYKDNNTTDKEGVRKYNRVIFSKGSFVSFIGTIEAIWADICCGEIYVSFKGRVINRIINKDHSMWILVDPLKHRKEYKIYTLKKQTLSNGDIVIEYPTNL